MTGIEINFCQVHLALKTAFCLCHTPSAKKNSNMGHDVLPSGTIVLRKL